MRVASALGHPLGELVFGTDFKCISGGACYGIGDPTHAIFIAFQRKLVDEARARGFTGKLPSGRGTLLVDGKIGTDTTYLAEWVAKRVASTGGGIAILAAARGGLTNQDTASMAAALLDELTSSEMSFEDDYVNGGPPATTTPTTAASRFYANANPLKTVKTAVVHPVEPATTKGLIPGTTSNRPLFIGLGVAAGIGVLALAVRAFRQQQLPAAGGVSGMLYGLGKTDLLDLYEQAMKKPSAFSDDDLRQIAARLDLRNDEARADRLRAKIRHRTFERRPSLFERHIAGY
jgi:hypothetical protein